MRLRGYTIAMLMVAVMAGQAGAEERSRERAEMPLELRLTEASGLSSVLEATGSIVLRLTGSLGLGFDMQPMRPAAPGVKGLPPTRAAFGDEEEASAAGLAAPAVFAFAPATPNPFDGGTTLTFDLPKESRVKLATYDVHGREVAGTKVEVLGAGRYQRRWEGVDAGGLKLSPGIYLVRLQAAAMDGSKSDEAVRKILKLR